MLAANADVNARIGKISATALMAAAQEGHMEVVQALLANGADVHAETTEHATAEKMASSQGHLEVATLLFQHVLCGTECSTQCRQRAQAYVVSCLGSNKDMDHVKECLGEAPSLANDCAANH